MYQLQKRENGNFAVEKSGRHHHDQGNISRDESGQHCVPSDVINHKEHSFPPIKNAWQA